ncbi:putative quinol monooxygenase [Streptomyces mangrovisoli]|uniref:ABM domain-containing protein n=1 Tax=Streptomyces mangrovisoli TaxID=1428628 RepID=A0A1J4P0Z5_9ACTN|nr:putative quinol monooxygenase [Streptomyces mangrovisoli]OIJ68409.1 hypothetical protein WN71_008295 [Streptomyces mangrovisoli]
MLIVLTRARAVTGSRDRLVTAAVEMARDTRGAPGCVSYTFAADLEDPDVIVCTEVWADRAALDAHLAHPRTSTFLTRVDGLTEAVPEATLHTTTG